MLGIPFLAFWILLFVGKDDLGLKGVVVCVAIWVALFLTFGYLDIAPYFVVAQALLDIVLVLIIFGGDIGRV